MSNAGLLGTRVVGLGRYVPERVLTNFDLERMVDTSDAWIRERTGISERHIAADHETASTMAVEAARRALAMAGCDPLDLDLIIVATTTPDGLFPAVSSLVQHRLGARRAGAFDINAACVAFLSAFSTASQFLATGACGRILIVGSEVLSRIVDWTDRSTCVLFGDGAGAAVLEAAPGSRPPAFVLHSDGGGAEALWAPGPCGPRPQLEDKYVVHMDGPTVFKFAVHAMEQVSREVMERAGWSPESIDLLVAHQANYRIIKATAKALGLPMERAIVNIDRYGNTSTASIPMALCEALEEGRLHEGDRVLMTAFGGGLVWGAVAFEWSGVSAAGPSQAPAASELSARAGHLR